MSRLDELNLRRKAAEMSSDETAEVASLPYIKLSSLHDQRQHTYLPHLASTHSLHA